MILKSAFLIIGSCFSFKVNQEIYIFQENDADNYMIQKVHFK